jgi:RNA recognition motif-containing protein
VTFEKAEDAAEALHSLNQTELGGRQIKVEMAKKPRADQNTRTRRDSPRRDVRARSPVRRRSSRSNSPRLRS